MSFLLLHFSLQTCIFAYAQAELPYKNKLLQL